MAYTGKVTSAESLGRILQQARLMSGLSQRELARRLRELEGLKGDPMRWAVGNPEVTSVKTMEGKESLSVDLASPEGRGIVHELVRGADVFVNGFRPGVAERLGLGWESMANRYTYFPMIGVLLMLVWLAEEISRGWRNAAAAHYAYTSGKT